MVGYHERLELLREGNPVRGGSGRVAISRMAVTFEKWLPGYPPVEHPTLGGGAGTPPGTEIPVLTTRHRPGSLSQGLKFLPLVNGQNPADGQHHHGVLFL